jgi:hypothetical protein
MGVGAVKKEFIVNRQGKDFVLYAGLLDQAHHEGLKRISTTLLQAPNPENGNMAICHAEVETEKGTFTGIGDASPDNVGRMIAMHTIRMAETRAKARALRDAINVGVTAFEELGDVEEDSSETRPQVSYRQPSRAMNSAPRAAAPAREEPVMHRVAEAPAEDSRETDSGLATQQQIDKLHKLQSALGRSAMVSSDMSSEEATRQISELVRIFNAQSRGNGTSRAR